MDRRRILQFDLAGDAPKLVFCDVYPDEPGPNEVRFAVHAYALNQADILMMSGRHYAVADLPFRVGYEACGVVEAIGGNVTKFKPGDRVTCIPNVDGPYAVAGEFALAHEDFLVHWPDHFSAYQACSYLMQYMTAYFPLKELFPVRAGDWVMITAASSSAGLGAIKIAKLLGAKVIGTTRTSAKRNFLLKEGADAVIVTDEENLVKRVMEITGGVGVNLVNDTIGGPFVDKYIEAIAEKATIYIHGGLSGTNLVSFQIVPLVRKKGMIHGYSLINETRDPAALERAKVFISEALANKRLPPARIDQIFFFGQAVEAYDYMRVGNQKGKIVVDVINR